MADITDSLGKHLLGEAVRLLVQAGVSGAAITDFIREYSEVVASSLASPPASKESELRAEVKAAVKEALLELAPPSRRTAAGMRKQMSVYVAGKKTSLSLRQDLVSRVQEEVGEKETRRLIHELANSKPKDKKNRTAWVEEHLQQHLLIQKVEAQVTRH